MTGTDLIVLAPWIAFAVGLAAICLLLLRPPRESRSRRSPRPLFGPAGALSRPGRAPADSTPADPAMAGPAPTDLAPTHPVPIDPALADPALADPASADLALADPAPTDRGRTSGLHPQEAICSQKNAQG
jgi:hypothetical protein